MLDPDELDAQIETTREFIDADPTVITLTPRTKTTTATGTKFVDGTPREPQRFKVISQAGLVSGSGRPTVTLDGVERVVEFVLLGMPDAKIARYDYWISDGVRFEVLEITDPFNQYERKALVERRG